MAVITEWQRQFMSRSIFRRTKGGAVVRPSNLPVNSAKWTFHPPSLFPYFGADNVTFFVGGINKVRGYCTEGSMVIVSCLMRKGRGCECN